MAEQKETCVTHLEGEERIGIYSSEQRNVNYIRKMAEKYPDEVVINRINPDGSICADFIGDKWNMQPKHKKDYTQEQKQAMATRMKNARNNKEEA